MRHRRGNSKLGKAADQRQALLRSSARNLFLNGRISTPLVRAKEIKRLAEKIITLAKKNDLAARRLVESMMGEKAIVTHIFKTIPDRFEGRAGGYTRIIKTGFRRGDASAMASLELI